MPMWREMALVRPRSCAREGGGVWPRVEVWRRRARRYLFCVRFRASSICNMINFDMLLGVLSSHIYQAGETIMEHDRKHDLKGFVIIIKSGTVQMNIMAPNERKQDLLLHAGM